MNSSINESNEIKVEAGMSKVRQLAASLGQSGDIDEATDDVSDLLRLVADVLELAQSLPIERVRSVVKDVRDITSDVARNLTLIALLDDHLSGDPASAPAH